MQNDFFALTWKTDTVNFSTCSLVRVEIRQIGEVKEGRNWYDSLKILITKIEEVSTNAPDKDNVFIKECKVTVTEKCYEIHDSFQCEIGMVYRKRGQIVLNLIENTAFSSRFQYITPNVFFGQGIRTGNEAN